MKKYDVICSLGASCASANFLKVFKLRLASGPFDWIIGGSFKSRVDLIINHFDGYFEFKDFKPIVNDGSDKAVPPDPKYMPFENIKTGLKYYHDFPVEYDFIKAHQIVKEKYDRRIARFYRSIVKADRVLLIWTEFGQSVNYDEVQQIVTKLRKTFGDKIEFLFLQNDAMISNKNVETIIDIPHLCAYKANIEFDTNGQYCGWQGNLSVASQIFKNYNLKSSMKHFVLQRCYIALFRILILLTPLKSLRHKMRDTLRDI